MFLRRGTSCWQGLSVSISSPPVPQERSKCPPQSVVCTVHRSKWAKPHCKLWSEALHPLHPRSSRIMIAFHIHPHSISLIFTTISLCVNQVHLLHLAWGRPAVWLQPLSTWTRAKYDIDARYGVPKHHVVTTLDAHHSQNAHECSTI